jgi:hypothetical protein
MVQELSSLWQHATDARQTVGQLVGESSALARSYQGSDGEFGKAAPAGDLPWVLWRAFTEHKMHLPSFELKLPPTLEASLASLTEAKIEDVRIMSHVQLDSSQRLLKQLAALEAETRSAINTTSKKAGARIQLRINPDGEETQDLLEYEDRNAALLALANLHKRVSAAETAHRHLLKTRTAADATVSPIAFRNV